MSRGHRISLVLALLIAVTLTPKLLTLSRVSQADQGRLTADVARMLHAQGFDAHIVHHRLFDYVLARRDGCRLAAVNAPPAGYLLTRFAGETAAIGPLTYAYGAPPQASFPRLRPVLEEYAQNWAHRLGIVLPRAPVIAIAASLNCRPASLPWGALRVWSTRITAAVDS